MGKLRRENRTNNGHSSTIKNKADDEVITQDQNIKEHKVEIKNYQSFPQNDKINDNYLKQLELLDNSLNSSINKFDKTIQLFLY